MAQPQGQNQGQELDHSIAVICLLDINSILKIGWKDVVVPEVSYIFSHHSQVFWWCFSYQTQGCNDRVCCSDCKAPWGTLWFAILSYINKKTDLKRMWRPLTVFPVCTGHEKKCILCYFEIELWTLWGALSSGHLQMFCWMRTKTPKGAIKTGVIQECLTPLGTK